MWQALQHAGWVETVATSRWLYGFLVVIHFSAVFFCIGTILLLDLRILGVAARNQALSPLIAQFRLWTWIACGSAIVSGFLLFTTKAGWYAETGLFRIKVLIVVLGVISALAIEWSAPRWDRAPAFPATARLLALISIVLWLGAILVAVEIPALTGLG